MTHDDGTAAAASRLRLLLWGFMGSGKSSVAVAIAKRTGVALHDLDERIEELSGTSIPKLFDREGEEGFRRREAKELRALLDAPGPCVVALGGGALLDPESHTLAHDRAFVVTLTAAPETLLSRTRGSARPLLTATDPRATVDELLARRAAAYRSTHAQISSEGRNVAQVCDDVLGWWSGWKKG